MTKASRRKESCVRCLGLRGCSIGVAPPGRPQCADPAFTGQQSLEDLCPCLLADHRYHFSVLLPVMLSVLDLQTWQPLGTVLACCFAEAEDFARCAIDVVTAPNMGIYDGVMEANRTSASSILSPLTCCAGQTTSAAGGTHLCKGKESRGRCRARGNGEADVQERIHTQGKSASPAKAAISHQPLLPGCLHLAWHSRRHVGCPSPCSFHI